MAGQEPSGWDLLRAETHARKPAHNRLSGTGGDGDGGCMRWIGKEGDGVWIPAVEKCTVCSHVRTMRLFLVDLYPTAWILTESAVP